MMHSLRLLQAVRAAIIWVYIIWSYELSMPFVIEKTLWAPVFIFHPLPNVLVLRICRNSCPFIMLMLFSCQHQRYDPCLPCIFCCHATWCNNAGCFDIHTFINISPSFGLCITLRSALNEHISMSLMFALPEATTADNIIPCCRRLFLSYDLQCDLLFVLSFFYPAFLVLLYSFENR